MTPHEFLDAKMQLSARHRFREVSGYRSPAQNTLIEANQGHPVLPYGPHQYWVGTDIEPDPTENRTMLIESARRVGLKALDEGTHLHLQPATWERG